MAARADRRNLKGRAHVIQCAIAEAMQGPCPTLTLDMLQLRLRVGRDAAERIVGRLVSSGVLQEIQYGLWARRGWVAAHLGR
jgi:hypothetical protein